MTCSTPEEFKLLVPNADFSFDDFGYGTQADVDEMKRFLDTAKRFKLQSLWARHPNRQGLITMLS